jgi:tetratricopeptide (TPR) repeat protein
MSEPVPFRYRAFLSYSHRDTAWGKWLHGALESYRIDKDLIGRHTSTGAVPKTLRPIFRDREDFSAGPSLNEQTRAALESSHFLVVICSPNAARSQYVNDEIRRYKALGGADRVIPVIVDGEPGDPERECFPPALRLKVSPDGALTDEREEPIAADARPQGDGKDVARLKVVAGLLGLGLDEIVRRAERARRRRLRNWVGALALLTVTFAGLAVWAEINRREAVVQRQYAEQALDAGIRTSNSLTGGLAERFRNRTGIQSALVKYILEQALVLQEKLASFGRSSPDLKRSESRAYRQTSTTLLTIGDTLGALAAAERARQIIESVQAVKPDDPDTQLDVAGSYETLGAVLVTQGKREEALAVFRKALATAQRVIGRDSGTAAVAKNSINIGDVLDAELKPDETLAAYHMSLAIWQKLAEQDQANAEWQQGLGMSYERIGGVLLTQGKRDEALAAFQKHLAIRQRLTNNDPNNTEFQFNLSVGHIKIGDVLLAQRKSDRALSAYQKALVIRQKLADGDQGSALWQREVAINYYLIADVMVATGKIEEALAAFQKGLTIEQKLAVGDPGNAQWQRDLYLSYERIGNVLQNEGKLDAALQAYRDSLAIAESQFKAHPDDFEWQRALPRSYDNVGNVLLTQGKLDQALTAYRDSLTTQERLAAADPSNTEWQRDLSLSHNRVGGALMAQGKLDEALTTYRAGLAIAERLAVANRSNTLWQRDLSACYEALGTVLLTQGKLDEALTAYRDSLTTQQRLAAADPSNTEWQRDLSVLYNKVGDVLIRQGRLDEALKAYRDGLTIRERLATVDPSNRQWQDDLQISISRIGGTAYNFILAHNFVEALETANQAISLAPEETWLYTNRAHALMFLNRTDEARILYLKYRGTKNVVGEKSWEASVLEDFAELRKAGLTNPLMDEIERRFAAGG